jgi:hypothetical protein
MRNLQFLFASPARALTRVVLFGQQTALKLPGDHKAQFLLATIASVLTLAVLLAEPAAAGQRPTNHNDTIVRI